MIDTQQQDIGQQLQDAVLQAAMDTVNASSDGAEKPEQKQKKGGISPLTGQPTPAGRPKGVRNRLTNLRDAVLEAFDTVGGPAYLVQLAQGTQSDRAAFISLVSKVLPTQINAQVEGGVQIQLSWLGSRQIGTTVAQPAEVVTEVIDLQRDNGGKYRIIDQPTQSAGGAGVAAAPGGVSPAGAGGAAGQAEQNGAGGASGA